MAYRSLISRIRRFARRDDGVALVEFALFLPVFLLGFFVIVEFGRTFFAYQSAVTGVRDATRYFARTIDTDICAGEINGAGQTISVGTASSKDQAYLIVERNMINEVDVLPTNVRIVRTATSYRCVVDAGAYRQVEVPIVQVFARITIVLPLGEILELNGRRLLRNIRTDVSDEFRVYGI